jgi:hypothetical protein
MTFKPTFTLQTYNLNSTFEIKFKNISRLLSYLSLTNKNHQHLISDSITNQVYFVSYNQLKTQDFQSKLIQNLFNHTQF